MSSRRNILLRVFPVMIILLGFGVSIQAQGPNPLYTLIQGGGIYGISTGPSADIPKMHGYQFQFVIGRNFDDRHFVGIGIGNDVYRQKSVLEGGQLNKISFLPIFLDYRLPFWRPGPLSQLGGMANAGYAPFVGSHFSEGFMGKIGLTYSQMLVDRSDLHLSVGYGFQEVGSRFRAQPFVQQNLFVTVGLFVY